MKRLVSSRKLKISFGLVYLKRSFMLHVWWYFGKIYQNLSLFMRMCSTVRGTLHIKHIRRRGSSPFLELWVGNVSVTNTKSGGYHFYISFIKGSLRKVWLIQVTSGKWNWGWGSLNCPAILYIYKIMLKLIIPEEMKFNEKVIFKKVETITMSGNPIRDHNDGTTKRNIYNL